ncbi:MAG: transglycosylase family protein [Solirubrobacterales bacterium]
MSMSLGSAILRVGSALAAALVAAVLVAAIAAGTAGASGGIGSGGEAGHQGGSGATAPKYVRLWERVSKRDRRWARSTAECESGGDPRAIGGGGRYRGAFQFMKSTWRTSPKSPGGDPIRFTYKTQAVVAVHLKKRAGTSPWPVCG